MFCTIKSGSKHLNLKKNSILFNMIQSCNEINLNQFEEINCNDFLQQTDLIYFRLRFSLMNIFNIYQRV